MNDKKFRVLINEVFNDHMMMSGRDYHTVNELLYVMRTDERLKDFNFNITLIRRDGVCCCIPSTDAFVPVEQLAMWFTDCVSECDTEEIRYEDKSYTWNCITIYEREEK